jgi:hypothetical protein
MEVRKQWEAFLPEEWQEREKRGDCPADLFRLHESQKHNQEMRVMDYG